MTKSFGFGFDVWLLEIDVNGDTIWTKRYSAGYFCSVQQTSDEGYILAGGKTSNNIKYHPSVSFDGTEYLLVWEEWNDDSPFLFGAKVDTSGNVNGPFLIYAQNGDVEGASLAKGLNDQLLITWSGWTPEINGQSTNTMRIWGKFNFQ